VLLHFIGAACVVNSLDLTLVGKSGENGAPQVKPPSTQTQIHERCIHTHELRHLMPLKPSNSIAMLPLRPQQPFFSIQELAFGESIGNKLERGRMTNLESIRFERHH
jgi:hypothetical protein